MSEHSSITSYILFECVGEVSKDILATAVVSALKKKYPKYSIVVTTLHPEVWLHNPHVYRVYRIDAAPYFYDNYVNGKNSKIFRLDPYASDEFLLQEKHILEAWCILCGVSYSGELPQLYFTQREKEVVSKMVASPKPVFLVHVNGEIGGIPYPVAWSRDVQKDAIRPVIRKMTEAGYDVIQIAVSDDQLVGGARRLVLDNRLLLCALMFTSKRLLIDSFLHHASTALNLSSVILWNSFTPLQHGYTMHTNIEPHYTEELLELQDTFIKQFRVTKSLPPFTPSNVPLLSFNADAIFQALEAQQ